MLKLDGTAQKEKAGAAETLPIEAIPRELLHERVFEQIKNALITGRFRPGAKLSLRGLAQSLGTSAMPVRDALQRLAALGVLTVNSNRTTSVPVLTLDKLDEIRSIRVMLEGLAAEYAANNALPQDIAALESSFKELKRGATGGKSDIFLLANWHFHRDIAAAGRSEILAGMIESLWLHLGPYIGMSTPNRAMMLASVPFHERVLDAIRKKKPGAARAAMIADINDCFDIFKHEAMTD